MVNSQIRVPDELWDKLKEISEKEERSINAQLIYILKKYIEEYESKLEKINSKNLFIIASFLYYFFYYIQYIYLNHGILVFGNQNLINQYL